MSTQKKIECYCDGCVGVIPAHPLFFDYTPMSEALSSFFFVQKVQIIHYLYQIEGKA